MLGYYATLHIHVAFCYLLYFRYPWEIHVEAIQGRHILAASCTMEIISSVIVSFVTITCKSASLFCVHEP